MAEGGSQKVMQNVLKMWKTLWHQKKGGARFFQVFPWVWLIAAYCITFAVLALYGRPYIDSDMASEMVLANLLKEEGGILSVNWWYSTEIEFCALPVFYEVGLSFFPTNWYAARIMGQAIAMLLLLLSYLYVGHGLKLKNSGVWGAAALACPFGVWYFWYGAFGGLYLMYMIWQLMSFGAILHLLFASKKRAYVLHGLLLAASCFLSGLNSVKGIMGFYLPMLLAACLIFLLKWNNKPQQLPERGKRLLIWSVVAALLACIGYLINGTFLAKNHLFKSYNGQEWVQLSFSQLLDKWAEFLSLFGHPGDGFLKDKIPLFSAIGLLGSFSLLTIFAIIVSTVRLLWRWKELNTSQLIAPVLLVWICIVQGIAFSCTGVPSSINASYWLTAVPFVFPVLQLEGETEHFSLKFTRKLAAIAFSCCFVATSIGATMQFFSSGYRINPHLETICDWLVGQGYTQGYATFWNGNVLTEWSNGQIEMWVTEDFNDMEMHQWLQKSSHQQPPEGQVFLITTQEELEKMGLSQLYWWSNVVYEDDSSQWLSKVGHYLVMTYKNYDDMMNAIHGAQSWEQEAAQETQDTQSA